MDLALELGMTVRSLKTIMTTDEFDMWVVYAGRKMLPMRRLEHYLARIAQVTAGGRLEDFLFDFKPQADQGGAVVAADALGGGARKIHLVKKDGD